MEVSCEKVVVETGVVGKSSVSGTNRTNDLAGGSIIPTLSYTTSEVFSPFGLVIADKMCLKSVQAFSFLAKVNPVGTLRQWTISIPVQA